ncbi:hypothetical protein TTHERM_001216069 (macronuclear) [Tetrahymena thermophila SB210]|uniref:Uncharacterized protein n=1 Tax=Tetrahymena thermophila (strain SB210) TaxID=312017 RepID=W7XH96_TETTS|nr:hypothetical protein TTHERM_001216069 [Tetrahymena thermophila SB210]EWS73721.1 hypothetical protein TTHERM_001216069 [Tetrahymena thermophila SB210]|eukprot:XP_012653759.1 hypothetical protein TTHERM_001216069 [Tetrahymena thermophila SB210]
MKQSKLQSLLIKFQMRLEQCKQHYQNLQLLLGQHIIDMLMLSFILMQLIVHSLQKHMHYCLCLHKCYLRYCFDLLKLNYLCYKKHTKNWKLGHFNLQFNCNQQLYKKLQLPYMSNYQQFLQIHIQYQHHDKPHFKRMIMGQSPIGVKLRL